MNFPAVNYETYHFDDAVAAGAGPYPLLPITTENHPNFQAFQPKLIEKNWLRGKCNWPDHLELQLREFMHNHKFYNYKKTDSNCNNLLNAITRQLRDLFDFKRWTEQDEEDLKAKIRHKMHRIRKEVTVDPTTAVKADLDRLDSKHHEVIFEYLAQRIGMPRARAIVGACESIGS